MRNINSMKHALKSESWERRVTLVVMDGKREVNLKYSLRHRLTFVEGC